MWGEMETGGGAPEGALGSMFLPAPATAAETDREVRARLASSLGWVAEGFAPLTLPEAGLDGWTARPADFGFYYDLASAVQHGFADDAREALGAVADALKQSFDASRDTGASQPRITTLGPDYYSPVEIDCLIRWFDMEPSNAMALVPLEPDELAAAVTSLNRALAVLQEHAPDFFGEFTAITTEIVFAKPDAGAKLRFGGASSFALWGALALNVQAHPDWWQYLPRIVHEYSHNLLFGIARDEPLVLNDPSETYSSPLRDDARPIDGIYHAAFVSAREALAMRQIAAGLEPRDEEDAALRSYVLTTADRSQAVFRDCLAVLREHARLSDLGAAVLADTEAWEASARGP